MSSITVSNLGKAYKQYPTHWSRLAEWLLPFTKPRHQLKWVLKDISFTVDPGDAVGIIGVNGAGKSTLLKMITGTTQPTEGVIQIKGRVAALLELGMGFHPDFTGRQNVFMAGQLLGLSIQEINTLMPEIEEFADIGEYIDQPVRVYSSGMQMRLAFSVATAKRPEILIVDEALAVGDASFQRKCFRRIEDFMHKGTSLLLVSHDIESVKRLCKKALFLHLGKLELIGSSKEVCDFYEQTVFGREVKKTINHSSSNLIDLSLSQLATDQTVIEKSYGDKGADINNIRLLTKNGESFNVIDEGDSFSVNYQVTFSAHAKGVRFGMMIKTVDGVCIYGTNTDKSSLKEDFNASDVVNVSFKLQGNLVPGTYYLNVGSTNNVDGNTAYLQRRVDCLIFRILSANQGTSMGYANMFGTPELMLESQVDVVE